MRAKAGLVSEGAEKETLTATGVENDVAGRWSQQLRDCMQQRRGCTEFVQSAARLEGSGCVTGVFRSPLLRLQQVNVPAASYVERMAAWTEQAALLACQWQVAMADGAEEHGSSVADAG